VDGSSAFSEINLITLEKSRYRPLPRQREIGLARWLLNSLSSENLISAKFRTEGELTMSIAMERFASEGRYPTYNPFQHEKQRIAVFQLQCRCCGYEPDAYVTPPRLCPKCRGETWERFARPGSILENAERY